MTQIAISTQQVLGSTGLAAGDEFKTSFTVTISAVDLTRSYVMLQSYASGRMICHTCPVVAAQFTPKGTADDGKTGQWAVELFDSTTVRFFRNTPVGTGCKHFIDARVVEYL